ncbi:type III secretion system export apparatus subunit SctV [Veronia pacifica]|uniref:EscV/YscV/HrcV family type III secretion system export apparatus protein n=1 Tax=Veronia pacifica TaxID=1080227 RepID=A0A1C3EQZ5_9GAMM|nr:type III secretion system export apparatus subunit SctV [Veronia pacifica]ODA35657.1 hypothetical protein A8L45_03320 [Veronia pacifica]
MIKQFLNRMSIQGGFGAELALILFVVFIVFMFIVPLPTMALDFLIGLNISFAVFLIILAMYIPKPTEFSSFPAILLITTLFRLAITISTTRQILLQADAGDIVETFGNFVAGGNLAVGLVIFLIITIAQFIVIAKGSERIAEVAARFNLDALPGKQMSIDGDLRAGVITGEQAQEKRTKLQEESGLYGALDGAMKFVKGDAIAGLIVVFVNLIGGLSVGMLQFDLDFGEAIQIYSILTIGDGLVGQIPALLISLTAGLIVSRVTSSQSDKESESVGLQIGKEFLAQPNAWLITTVVLIAFSLVPGMPTAVFIALSAASGIVWITIIAKRRAMQKAMMEHQQQAVDLRTVGDRDIMDVSVTSPYILCFHTNRQNDPRAHNLVADIRRCRNTLVIDYGIFLPELLVVFRERVSEDEFAFFVNEIVEMKATFPVEEDKFAVKKALVDSKSSDSVDVYASSIKEKTRKETDYYWLSKEDCDTLDIEKDHRFTPYDIIVPRFRDTIFRTSASFLGLQETKTYLTFLAETKPDLIEELTRVIPVPTISAVLRFLAEEQVSIRTFATIVEVLVEFGNSEKNPSVLTNYVRYSLGKQITQTFLYNDILHVVLLSPELEELCRTFLRLNSGEAFLALQNEHMEMMHRQIKEITDYVEHSKIPIVLLAATDLRRPLWDMQEVYDKRIPVVAFNEVPTTIELTVYNYIDVDQGTGADNVHQIDSA